MDLLVLAELDGVLDMTPEAIAAITRIPLNIVTEHLKTLELPDPESRTHTAQGRRIVRIDPKRNWGWRIVNYDKYRKTASEEQRREHTKARTRKWRKTKTISAAACDAPVTHGDAVVTQRDAGDAIQKQKQTDKHIKRVGTALAVSCVANEAKDIVDGKRTAFTRPTVEAMRLQAAKIGLPEAQAEQCFDYYESNGWKVGRNPMKSWVSAIANWKRNFDARRFNSPSSPSPEKSYAQMTAEELDRITREALL